MPSINDKNSSVTMARNFLSFLWGLREIVIPTQYKIAKLVCPWDGLPLTTMNILSNVVLEEVIWHIENNFQEKVNVGYYSVYN